MSARQPRYARRNLRGVRLSGRGTRWWIQERRMRVCLPVRLLKRIRWWNWREWKTMPGRGD